jgi:iron only hydrogenase large subunit-like protein
MLMPKVPLTAETQLLLSSLDKKEKLVAMIAPSFPVMFSYPSIVAKLKRLGFSKVVEVSLGAVQTNQQLYDLLKNNPRARYITSPCPTIVRLIRTQYPGLVKYLSPTDSPMVATAKIVRKEFPGYKIFFIGPCLLKKQEASQDHPELQITVLTYRELVQIFTIRKIKSEKRDFLASFDLAGRNTRLYPISGGLSQSAGLNDILADEEYDVISGLPRVIESLKNFESNPKLRVLDILNCDGGCISGPGVVSPLSLEKRRLKVISHWAKQVR